ncbi:type II toxin-antitoxin system prevent-host-death family antitoxin [Streptomyces rimosus]|uniref:type II toxin-antitoxin system Phd/YefM family antitoxin n=1 Tax=Streptomyces rimosus TaxID=1927 RepID=UPI0031D08DBB
MEDETYPLVQARSGLGQLVSRVRHGRAHIVISEYGKPAAALVPVDELEELRRLRDEADIAEVWQHTAARGTKTHETFVDELEAEDRRAAAW